jgi:hypothetical protein
MRWPAIATSLFALAFSPLHAAKNPDKPDKPDKPSRAEKIERRLERSALAVDADTSRDVMAALAQDRPSGSERSFDRSSRGSRSDRSDRGGIGGNSQNAATPADAKFDQFRLITERNIFNPNRIGRVRATTEEKAPRVDTIALVGTMEYEKGVIAFFDSPDPALRKTLRAGQSVGEFKVAQIKPDSVELVRTDGKPVSLKVAQQLRRPEGGEWSISAVERPTGDSAGSASGEAGRASEPASPPPIPTDASDALRRLMEARQKQLKQ